MKGFKGKKGMTWKCNSFALSLQRFFIPYAQLMVKRSLYEQGDVRDLLAFFFHLSFFYLFLLYLII